VEHITLAIVATPFPQQARHRHRLDTFGHGLKVQGFRQVQYRANDLLIALVRIQGPDKSHVDLQGRDTQFLQVSQGRMPDAKIID